MKLLALVLLFGIFTIACVTAMPILREEQVVMFGTPAKKRKGNNKKRTRGRKQSHITK